MLYVINYDQRLVEKNHLALNGSYLMANPVFVPVSLVPVKSFDKVKFIHLYIIAIYAFIRKSNDLVMTEPFKAADSTTAK